MPARKATAIVQLKVRLREDLRRRLEREANRRKDSINNEIVQRLEQSFLVPDVAEATANAVMEHLTLRIGGKPVVMEVDYTQDPGGALRGWKVPTGDEAKALLRRPHMEVGRESPTPKLEPGKTSKEGKSK
jgi:Arc-like DNA binding domain